MEPESKQEPLPPVLYKYRSWDDKNHRRMLWHSEIYFASPKDFNDPFDCKIPIDYTKLPDGEVIDRLKQTPMLANCDAKVLLEVWHQGGLKDDPTLRRMIIESMDDWTDGHYGFFSLASIRDELLMWSHYGDSHRGFCVGFDVHRLSAELGITGRFVDDEREWMKIDYCRTMPVLQPRSLLDLDTVRRRYTTKACCWSHEGEYRVAGNKPGEVVVCPDSDIIIEVILGCAMPESDKQEIISVLKMREHKPKLFQATKKELEFGLDIVPIDY
jgi:hypothetical protein